MRTRAVAASVIPIVLILALVFSVSCGSGAPNPPQNPFPPKPTEPTQAIAAAGPLVSVRPTSLSITVNQGQTLATPSDVVVSNNGGADSTLNYMPTAQPEWIKLSGPIRPLKGGDSERYEVYVDVSGFKPGTYNGTINIANKDAPDKSASVPVTVIVRAPTPTIATTTTTATSTTTAVTTQTTTAASTSSGLSIPPVPPAKEANATTTSAATAATTAATSSAPPAGGSGDVVIAGNWQGKYTTDATGRCPAQTGTWKATITQNGNNLAIAWFDSYHGQTFNINSTLNGQATTFTAGSGDDSITLTPTFKPGGVLDGKLLGPNLGCSSKEPRPAGGLQGNLIR